MATRLQPITLSEEEVQHEELKVTFYPPLFLQRRIWVLGVLRNENIAQVLDVGCGEGQLLTALCQPAPWLTPPPHSIVPPLDETLPSEQIPPSPTYNDEIPNLHPTHVFGLDISLADLAFAVEGTAPQPEEPVSNGGGADYLRLLTSVGLRWEDLQVKLWKGGLEHINEEFVNFECIVSTEVIEHLPPRIFPAFAPALLGVYHPRLLLITTPSYTFNARFTAPDAPPSARQGYLDPTQRTDRIFRHDDHKFEWTAEEFVTWCQDVAHEWGYEVQTSTIGRALEIDDWGRDEELGGATSVAVFRRVGDGGVKEREEKARKILKDLALEEEGHELLVTHQHSAHSSSRKPRPFNEIGEKITAKMEEVREAFMRVEELWFEQEISTMCGGWIEVFVRAVEESDTLILKRDGPDMKRGRTMWVVELIGGVTQPRVLWPPEGSPSGSRDRENSVDYIPPDWIPEESDSEEGDWEGSTGADGDVSRDASDSESVDVENPPWRQTWHKEEPEEDGWSSDPDWARNSWGQTGKPSASKIPQSSSGSTNGWDGDESDDTTS